jgi:hypothetical protein
MESHKSHVPNHQPDIYIYIPTGVLNSALSAMAQTSLLASETVMTTEQPKVVVIMAAEHSMDL